ncbi:MAG: hypothetical protein KAR40_18005 [Candidatus Sabulitectum sp.]|nr:hypothetical protein [Candidatus Sabulitectum sp.]
MTTKWLNTSVTIAAFALFAVFTIVHIRCINTHDSIYIIKYSEYYWLCIAAMTTIQVSNIVKYPSLNELMYATSPINKIKYFVRETAHIYFMTLMNTSLWVIAIWIIGISTGYGSILSIITIVIGIITYSYMVTIVIMLIQQIFRGIYGDMISVIVPWSITLLLMREDTMMIERYLRYIWIVYPVDRALEAIGYGNGMMDMTIITMKDAISMAIWGMLAPMIVFIIFKYRRAL